MHYKTGTDRHQTFLFNSLEDCIEPNNPIRLIDALVNRMVFDNPEKFAYKGQTIYGRKSYSPSVLLKLYLYGYLNRIPSSRRLETESRRNIELKWLLNDQHPDFKTIADYRKDNKEAIRSITLGFREFLLKEGYIEGNKITFDGSKIKACTSCDKEITTSFIHAKMQNLEEQLEGYLTQLHGNDHVDNLEEELDNLCRHLDIDKAVLEEISSLRSKVKELEEISRKLEQENRNSYFTNDPDARLMKSRDGFIPAYNLQVGTDAKHKMIVLSEITTNGNDYNMLQENCEKVIEQVSTIPETVLADTGYGNMQQIETLESQELKIQCVIPRQVSVCKEKDKQNGIQFTYDPQSDSYTCIQGKKLIRKKRTSLVGNTIYLIYQASNLDCKTCSLRNKCHPSKAREGRSIKVPDNHQYRDRYDQKLLFPESKKLIKERKDLIEHVFGTLKRWMGKVPILLTSKEKVQIEIDLYATAYNIRRLLSITPVTQVLMKL
jgi:transposase